MTPKANFAEDILFDDSSFARVCTLSSQRQTGQCDCEDCNCEGDNDCANDCNCGDDWQC